MSACLCDPCGREFTGLGPFDKHQDVDYSRRPAVRCLDPAALGMERNAHGRWGFPADADSREALRRMRAERGRPRMTGTPRP